MIGRKAAEGPPDSGMTEPILTVPSIGCSSRAGSAHVDVSMVQPGGSGWVTGVVSAVGAMVVVFDIGTGVTGTGPRSVEVGDVSPPEQATNVSATAAQIAHRPGWRFVTCSPL